MMFNRSCREAISDVMVSFQRESSIARRTNLLREFFDVGEEWSYPWLSVLHLGSSMRFLIEGMLFNVFSQNKNALLSSQMIWESDLKELS